MKTLDNVLNNFTSVRSSIFRIFKLVSSSYEVLKVNLKKLFVKKTERERVTITSCERAAFNVRKKPKKGQHYFLAFHAILGWARLHTVVRH